MYDCLVLVFSHGERMCLDCVLSRRFVFFLVLSQDTCRYVLWGLEKIG
jgi:hypothetical protein